MYLLCIRLFELFNIYFINSIALESTKFVTYFSLNVVLGISITFRGCPKGFKITKKVFAIHYKLIFFS